MADRPRIAHVGVAVPDLDAALAFYRDVLGLTPASRRRRPTAPPSSRCRSASPRSSCSRRSRPTDPSPGSSNAAGRASITSATACPISTRRSPPAGRPATGWWTRFPAPEPADAGSPSCIRRRPPASCSSSPSKITARGDGSSRGDQGLRVDAVSLAEGSQGLAGLPAAARST